MKTVKRIILSLTAGAVILSAGAVATKRSIKDEKPELLTVIYCTCGDRAVHNSVENVENTEDSSQIVDNPVNDVHNFVEEELLYTDKQHEILAIVIYQEAGGDNYSNDTRRKVGSVFINRVNSALYPDTFEEVATQKRQYGKLYWTGLKWPERASKPQESHAVQRAYDIAEELLTTGSVLPDNVIYQAEFKQGDGVYCEQEGFYFCYLEVNNENIE